MGYRHIMVSDTMVPTKEQLPTWFTDKYDGFISFKEDVDYWCSYAEHKMYGAFRDFPEDTQKAMNEANLFTGWGQVELIWFADEGDAGGVPYQFTRITADSIKSGYFEPVFFNEES